jgi:hypothetical protein
MRHEESQIQIAWIEWLNLQYPHLAKYALHVPNGGKMSIWKGQYLKRMGVQAGVADILFMWPHGEYHGLWLEFKSSKGKQSEAQEAFELRCHVVNYCYKLVRSLDDAIKAFNKYIGGK